MAASIVTTTTLVPPAGTNLQNEQCQDMYKLITDSIQRLGAKLKLKQSWPHREKRQSVLISRPLHAEHSCLIWLKKYIILAFWMNETKALWDTGSQFCLINKKGILHSPVKNVSEFLVQMY